MQACKISSNQDRVTFFNLGRHRATAYKLSKDCHWRMTDNLVTKRGFLKVYLDPMVRSFVSPDWPLKREMSKINFLNSS